MRRLDYGCWICADRGWIYKNGREQSCPCSCHARKPRPVRLMPLIEAFLADYNATELWEP